MGLISFFKGLFARVLFSIHCVVTIWRVSDVYTEPIYYIMLAPILFLIVELIVTLKCTENGEWKWFCPSVFLYLVSVVPGQWLLQFDLLHQREKHRDANGWEDCTEESSSIFNETGLEEIQGVTIPLALSDDKWALALEQLMLCLLILGRWLLPKGSLTRDQLSQLLLVYIGMAADILEFSMESLSEPAIMCNVMMMIIILTLWSVALSQFTLVLTSVAAAKSRNFATKRQFLFCGGCCANEIWSLWITLVLQDVPFLAMRLYLILNFDIINQMMLFFTCKNLLMIGLQFYRMSIVCCANEVSPTDEFEPELDRISVSSHARLVVVKEGQTPVESR